jgi:hypothetical protein
VEAKVKLKFAATRAGETKRKDTYSLKLGGFFGNAS